MQPFISKIEVQNHVNSLNTNVFEEKEFLEMFDSLTQKKVVIQDSVQFRREEISLDTYFYFIDKRGARLYSVHRASDNKKLFIDNTFDAQEISVFEFKRKLPLNTDYYRIVPSFNSYDFFNLFYADLDVAFKVPVVEILSEQCFDGISKISGDQLFLEFQSDKLYADVFMDRYAGMKSWYYYIHYRFEINPATFQITLVEKEFDKYKY